MPTHANPDADGLTIRPFTFGVTLGTRLNALRQVFLPAGVEAVLLDAYDLPPTEHLGAFTDQDRLIGALRISGLATLLDYLRLTAIRGLHPRDKLVGRLVGRISVDAFRGQGIGWRLLTAALDRIFSDPAVPGVSFMVRLHGADDPAPLWSDRLGCEPLHGEYVSHDIPGFASRVRVLRLSRERHRARPPGLLQRVGTTSSETYR